MLDGPISTRSRLSVRSSERHDFARKRTLAGGSIPVRTELERGVVRSVHRLIAYREFESPSLRRVVPGSPHPGLTPILHNPIRSDLRRLPMLTSLRKSLRIVGVTLLVVSPIALAQGILPCPDHVGQMHNPGEFQCFSRDPNDWWWYCTGFSEGPGSNGTWIKTNTHCNQQPQPPASVF